MDDRLKIFSDLGMVEVERYYEALLFEFKAWLIVMIAVLLISIITLIVLRILVNKVIIDETDLLYCLGTCFAIGGVVVGIMFIIISTYSIIELKLYPEKVLFEHITNINMLR